MAGNYEQETSVFLNKPLPSDPQAERSLIAGVFLDNDVFDKIEDTDPEAYYSPNNKRIFLAMKACRGRGEVLDPITVGNELKAQDQLDAIGGVGHLTNYTYGMPHLSDRGVQDWLKIVMDKFVAREAIKRINEATYALLDESENVGEIILKADAALIREYSRLKSSRMTKRKGFYSLADMKNEFKAQLEDYHYNRVKVVKTGMDDIDDKLGGGGLQKGGFYLLSAPPKIGKTSLVLDWGQDASFNQGFTVLAASAEMHRLQYMRRMYAKHIGVKYWHFRPGMYGDSYERAIKDLDEFVKNPFRITDNLHTVEDIKFYCRREVDLAPKEKPVGLIIIDYLQLFSLSEIMDYKRRAAEVGTVSREFKMLATELEVPILAISTMNRESMRVVTEKDGTRKVLRPTMYGLKESGNLEYDAEGVFFLFDEQDIPGSEYKRGPIADIEFIIDVQRDGPSAIIPMKLMGEYMNFMTATEFNAKFRADTSKEQNQIIERPLLQQRQAAQDTDDEIWENL